MSHSYSYTSVKDYAYEEENPLHHGIIRSTISSTSSFEFPDEHNADIYKENDLDDGRHRYLFEDGPPWKEDIHESAHTANSNPNSLHKNLQYQISSSDEINRKAIALFEFVPENDNEVALKEGQVIWISYRHGQGWLVAEDPITGENGLVPEEYVEIYEQEEEADDEDNIYEEDQPKPFLPPILRSPEEDEWIDTEDENEHHEDETGITEKVAELSIH